jgi:hypothetical protein
MTRTSTYALFAAVATLAVAASSVAGDSGRAAVLATPKLQRLATVRTTMAQAVALARSNDGVLHLVYQSLAGTSVTGLATIAINPSGKAGAPVQALGGWDVGQPGLIAYPNGTLDAYFGAISPGNVSSVWAITSSDGGTTWTAPSNIRVGGPNESLAYGSDVTAALTGSTQVVALPQAGNLVVQVGLGAGANANLVTNASDGSMTDADLAVDASSGAVVAGWNSIAHDPRLYLQGVTPSGGKLQAVPGQSRNAVVLAGRDSGPGVFAAYTTDGKHIRLLRYGGGSVAVGSRAGTSAKVLAAATSLDGRIWVMWGDDSGGGIALTRSNKAVTRFEPLQHVAFDANGLARLEGDGRLGPLDLIADAVPGGKTAQPAGIYYARVLPVLDSSTSVAKLKNKKGTVIGYTVAVHVTDAGDPVSAATVSLGGQQKKTSASGTASFKLPVSKAGTVHGTVSAAGYSAHQFTVNV